MSGAGGVRGNLLVGSVATGVVDATELEVATEDISVVLCLVEYVAVILSVFPEVPENKNVMLCKIYLYERHIGLMLYIDT